MAQGCRHGRERRKRSRWGGTCRFDGNCGPKLAYGVGYLRIRRCRLSPRDFRWVAHERAPYGDGNRRAAGVTRRNGHGAACWRTGAPNDTKIADVEHPNKRTVIRVFGPGRKEAGSSRKRAQPPDTTRAGPLTAKDEADIRTVIGLPNGQLSFHHRKTSDLLEPSRSGPLGPARTPLRVQDRAAQMR